MIFAASHSMPYMAYIAHVVTGVWCGEVGICDARVEGVRKILKGIIKTFFIIIIKIIKIPV